MKRVMVGAAILVAGLLGGCATQPPLPDVAQVRAMPDGRQAPIPAGFISFCLRYADQCQFKSGDTNVISLNKDTWHTLSRVNRDVNNAIWPQDDLSHFGRAEYWTIPTDGYGVCHDYAVTKRKHLSDAGFPLAALRIAVVYSVRSGRHAVLTVATDKGDLVLDNMTYDILPWDAAGYTWIERQDSVDPMKWVSLLPTQQPTMMAQNGLTTAGTITQGVPLPQAGSSAISLQN